MVVTVQTTTDDVETLHTRWYCNNRQSFSAILPWSERQQKEHLQQFILAGNDQNLVGPGAARCGGNAPVGFLIAMDAGSGDDWLVGRGCAAGIPVQTSQGELEWDPNDIGEFIKQDNAAAQAAFAALRGKMWTLDEIKRGGITCNIFYGEDSPAFPDY
ncbi:MAG: hypothetical protein Q7T01_01005 [bacterium]|nr:hypothetical protein [bacterium]